MMDLAKYHYILFRTTETPLMFRVFLVWFFFNYVFASCLYFSICSYYLNLVSLLFHYCVGLSLVTWCYMASNLLVQDIKTHGWFFFFRKLVSYLNSDFKSFVRCMQEFVIFCQNCTINCLNLSVLVSTLKLTSIKGHKK